LFTRLVMDGESERGIPRADRHNGPKSRRGEVATAVSGLLHGACCGIRVRLNDDSVERGYVKVAEHVALAEGGKKHLLWIPPLRVAVKSAVARACNVGVSLRAHYVIAAVGPVGARSGAAVACPLDIRRVVVL